MLNTLNGNTHTYTAFNVPESVVIDALYAKQEYFLHVLSSCPQKLAAFAQVTDIF